jgi:hypothetical protein
MHSKDALSQLWVLHEELTDAGDCSLHVSKGEKVTIHFRQLLVFKKADRIFSFVWSELVSEFHAKGL